MDDALGAGDDVTLRLTRDQALVLSDWLDRMEGADAFARVVDDPAVWSALHRISGTLGKGLSEVFAPDYTERLRAARERLVEELGEEFVREAGGKPDAPGT
ncbi:hypothetical protein [Nocardiopsis lucentensis]|uniref:hypothetical protein n=1 Tax=Nocardiopsis lucentensis TaxID=53441 RepID=UPI00034628A1|nr:hypothetical protein [Nocardiopsis lucentensis]